MERFLPMLAVQSQPFDSAEHLFEVKWDGVRAVAAVEAGHWNVWGRELADYTQRYPELDPLRRLPSGTVLDGELVLLRSGRADLQELMRRHQLVGAQKSRRPVVGYRRRTWSSIWYTTAAGHFGVGRWLSVDCFWRNCWTSTQATGWSFRRELPDQGTPSLTRSSSRATKA